MSSVPFVRAFEEAGVQVQYPSAVPRPYTLFGGRTTSVWFDRRAMDPRSPEQTEIAADYPSGKRERERHSDRNEPDDRQLRPPLR